MARSWSKVAVPNRGSASVKRRTMRLQGLLRIKAISAWFKWCPLVGFLRVILTKITDC
jgi:hypothetical protein